MQNKKEDRYARVMKVLDAEVETTKAEMDRLYRVYDETEDEDYRSDVYEICIDAELAYRNALAKLEQVMSID